jgi:YhcN/YlaJ family sporulation lipoprotein
MKRYWIWGLGLMALLLAVVFAIPQQSQNGRVDQRLIPGTPTRTDLDTSQLRTPDTNPPQTPQSVTMSARLSNRVTDAARSVEGVEQAWAAVKGTTAVVGLTVDPSLNKDATADTKSAVAEQVRELPEILHVGVTTDPDLIRQIRDTGQAIAANQPPTQWDSKLQTLIDQLVPSTR